MIIMILLAMYNTDKNRPNSIKWVSKVRDLLFTLGFHEVWLNQGVGNKNIFLAEFKIRLNDNFVQNWNSRISESSRATSNFNFQLYLETVKVKMFRIALSKLRLSSHRLEIEVGRWARPNRTPIDQRKCHICNKL